MAHMQKFKSSSAAHIIGHCEREKSKEGYLKYRNGSYIDETKTELNLSYPDPANGQQRLKARLNKIAPKRRKDAVTMVDWVITLPEPLLESNKKEQLEFFKLSTAFMAERYGEENLVGAYIHFDETTPHLHYCFVPVVKDQDGTERLCAKQLMSKKELNHFHKDLDKTLESYFDMPGLVLTGATKAQGGNKSVSQLKKVSKQVDVLKTAKNRLEDKIKALRGQLLDGLDHDMVIELFKDLPADEQFRAMVETELPETQLQPKLMESLYMAYMESPYSSVIDERLLADLKKIAETQLEKVKEFDFEDELF